MTRLIVNANVNFFILDEVSFNAVFDFRQIYRLLMDENKSVDKRMTTVYNAFSTFAKKRKQ